MVPPLWPFFGCFQCGCECLRRFQSFCHAVVGSFLLTPCKITVTAVLFVTVRIVPVYFRLHIRDSESNYITCQLGQSTYSHNLPPNGYFAWTSSSSNWETILLYNFFRVVYPSGELCTHMHTCFPTERVLARMVGMSSRPPWRCRVPLARGAREHCIRIAPEPCDRAPQRSSPVCIRCCRTQQPVAKGKQTSFYLRKCLLEFAHRYIGDVDLCHDHHVGFVAFIHFSPRSVSKRVRVLFNIGESTLYHGACFLFE